MAAMRYLLLTVTLACLFRGGISVSDQEFQDHLISVNGIMVEMKKEIQDLHLTVGQLKADNLELVGVVKTQASEISKLKNENRREDAVISQLQAVLITNRQYKPDAGAALVQNNTIEERVTLLEVQVTDMREDITEIDEDVTGLDENVSFLFDEQVIQDERLLNLEEATDQINGHLIEVDDNIEGLQDTTLALDFRVTVLEENGGSDGNSSISELEERVETLEGTSADHETRITSAEGDVEDLEGSSADHETRLTSAEENIQGLQTTDVSLDARITALEESGGGSQNETIAFHAVLTSYSTIPDETNVEFNEIVLNEGNGYDSTTGTFTVPPGGSGMYYFSTYLLVQFDEKAWFDIQLNDDVICTAEGDHGNSGQSETSQATCSAVVSVVEGDEVKVVLRSGDTTPLYADTVNYYDGFNGFRI